MGVQEAVIAVGFTRQHALQLLLGRDIAQTAKRRFRFGDQILIALSLGQFDHFNIVVQAGFQVQKAGNPGFQRGPFAHHLLGGGGVIPQGRVFDTRV